VVVLKAIPPSLVPNQVLAEVSGKNKAAVERLLIDCGDLGSLAVEVRSKVRVLFKSPRLTLKTVRSPLNAPLPIYMQRSFRRSSDGLGNANKLGVILQSFLTYCFTALRRVLLLVLLRLCLY
jgi:hypothetical protein